MSPMRSALWKRNKEKLLPGEKQLTRPSDGHRRPISEAWSPVGLKGRGGVTCPPGDIWQCLETFWVVTTGGGGCPRHPVGTGQGCDYMSHRTPPNTEAHHTPNVSSALIEKQLNTRQKSFLSSLKVLGKWSPLVTGHVP